MVALLPITLLKKGGLAADLVAIECCGCPVLQQPAVASVVTSVVEHKLSST